MLPPSNSDGLGTYTCRIASASAAVAADAANCSPDFV
jgi:hypothetical protein